MINIENGHMRIGEELMIFPEFSFEDFKKTKYYNSQDDIRMIYLDETEDIDGKKYYVSLLFKEKIIYSVSLVYCDIEISEKEEPKRKKIHDDILRQSRIDINREYHWGSVTSDFDARGNVSSIIIFYNH